MVIPPGFPRARTYAAGTYETETTAVFRDILRKGMTFIDAGAFCGYYTLLSSNLVGNSGRVYAFEPEPKNYTYLMRNISDNNCQNVIIVNKAVSKENGFALLVQDKEADHHWLTSPSNSGGSVEVQTVTLDYFFAQAGWPSVDFIKIDIEGSEFAALVGMKELNQRNPHLQLVMEYDVANLRRAGATPEALDALLCEMGFLHGYVIEQNMKSFPITNGLPRSHATYDLLLKKE
jgi:FkbM family methyltransferase